MKRISLFFIIALLVFVQNDAWAQRGGATTTQPGAGTATQRGEVRKARRHGITSGVTAINQSLPSELSPAPAKRSLTDINLLKYAFIDSKTRVVTLVGSYDKTYATGPIPYYDLLKETLESPYPYFSLEPTQATRSAVDNLQANIASDTQRMFNDRAYVNEWTQRLMFLLLRDLQLQQDHYRFVKKAADAFKVSNDEVMQILSLTNGDYPSPEMQVIMIKVLKGMGYNNVAFALEYADGSRETARKIYTKFGRINEIEPIWAKWDAREITDAQGKIEIASRLYGSYLLELGVPAAEVSAKENAVRSGSMSLDELEKFYTDKLTASIVDNIGVKMFNGVTLSQALLSKLYNVPLPQMELVFKNLPAQTNLAKVMFEADYMLKSLTALPDVKEKVPGHLTNLEYLDEESRKQGIRTPTGAGGEVRNTLLPGNVKMRISPNGKVVAFDDAQVKIESALLKPVGNLGSAETLVRNSFTAYGNFLTGRYDLYARAYPPLHRMREVEKLIALARWAKANNYKLVVDKSEGSKVSLPATASGFWNAIFAADQQEVSLTVVALGGADFSQQYGDSWAQSSSDPTVENSAVKQLAASTAFAQKAAEEAIAGNLENARDLAEKSAQAMTGNIDISQLPGLKDIPVSPEPAMAAALDIEAQSITDKSLRAMDEAKAMRQQADALPGNSAQEAAKLREEAARQEQDAQADLKRLNDAMNAVRQDPASIGNTVTALRSGSGTPFFGAGGSNTNIGVPQATGAASGPSAPAAPKPVDWSTKCSKWIAELDEVNRQIASTRAVLLKLNASIQSDRKQFVEWENAASDGFDRCVRMAADTIIDFSAGALLERYETIYELAKKLPNKPEALIEKYRLLASLAKRLQEAKATGDYAGLAASENKTEAEIYATMRDGIGQIIGLLSLDKTVPGMAWKYGSLGWDMAYNLKELQLGWKNVGVLEANNVRYAEAVKKLSARMQELEDRAKKLRQKIEAGEPVDFSAKAR
ncbi:MAG: hypothetical protein NTZ92_07970 [Candidatus Omnitrophica bacterium]|nr:hypothetical protein [Candidatus Omnitrophota bacterium]